MGRPTTLLEGLCGHALSLGAQSIEVEYKDGRGWVFAFKDGTGIGVFNYTRSSSDGEELSGNLYAAKKPVRTVLDGQVYILKVRVSESFGEDAFAVSIDPAPKPDPRLHRHSRQNRVNIWPSSTTTPRSTAVNPRSGTWSATSRFPRPQFTK